MSFGRIKSHFRSLRGQVILWYSAAFLGGLALLTAVGSKIALEAIERSERATLEGSRQSIVEWYGGIGYEAFKQEMENDPPDVGAPLLRLSSPEGATLLFRIPRGSPSVETSWAGQQLKSHRIAEWSNLRMDPAHGVWRVLTVPLSDGRWLQLAKNDGSSRDLLRPIRNAVAVAALLALVLAVAGGIVVTGRALRPIQQLVETSQRVVTSGDMTARVPVRTRGDELDELSRVFNAMLERNENLIRSMREALDNVAHDLRTPLARLRGHVEHALDQPPDVKVLREALTDALEESDRVQTVLHSLMDISEVEGGVMTLRLESVDLVEIVKDVVDLYEYVGEEHSIAVETSLPETAIVRVDGARLGQAVANLLDNAIKYGRTGGRVWIEIVSEEDAVRVSIRDNGIGILAEEIPRIWERLYRGDKSRTQRGAGLGLSLVKAIVEAHHGRVGVNSTFGVGSRFSIFIPAGTAKEPAAAAGERRNGVEA